MRVAELAHPPRADACRPLGLDLRDDLGADWDGGSAEPSPGQTLAEQLLALLASLTAFGLRPLEQLS